MDERIAEIRYCPLCGHESDKKFIERDGSGGHWICENCDELVEAYLLEKRYVLEECAEESSEEDGDSGKSIGKILLFVVIIAAIIFGIAYFS